MPGRRQPRTRCVLPVRVLGTDALGNPFQQLTCTLDISGRGARISGIRARLETGTTVTVHYKSRRAPFRVMWVGTPGSENEDQIGVTTIDPEAHFWIEVPAKERYVDEYYATEKQEQEKVKTSRAKHLAAAPASSHEATDRLQSTTEELLDVARLLERGIVDAAALQQFRQALTHVRNTSWILQQWLGLEQNPKQRLPLLTMLNEERLRIATNVCNELAAFFTAVKVQFSPELMQQFTTAVQQLFLILTAAEEQKPSGEPQPGTPASPHRQNEHD